MSLDLRPYQQEAVDAVLEYWNTWDDEDFEDAAEFTGCKQCVLKMACGTGKSRVMIKIAESILSSFSVSEEDEEEQEERGKIILFVFPSLSLQDQFQRDYLLTYFPEINTLGVCSAQDISHEIGNEKGSEKEEETRQLLTISNTTDLQRIRSFLEEEEDEDEDEEEFASSKPKLLCVTYHSLQNLEDLLIEMDIRATAMMFDEAHWTKKQFFNAERTNRICERQLFVTATPTEEMREYGICGPIVYDYSCARAIEDGFLSPFELRFLFHCDKNATQSRVQTMMKVAEETGNKRVLAFCSRVHVSGNDDDFDKEEDGDDEDSSLQEETENKKVSVSEFTTECISREISHVFRLDASVNMVNRRSLLSEFANTPGNELAVLSSCKTIGEGVDTKNANMIYFVDSKKSYVDIIQNIGRGLRKEENKLTTVLIPVFVDVNEYQEVKGNAEKVNELFIQSMSELKNDFSRISAVCAALKCDDEELFYQCLQSMTHSKKKQETNDDNDDGSLKSKDSSSFGEKNTKVKMSLSFSEDLLLQWEIQDNVDWKEKEEYRSEKCFSSVVSAVFKKSGMEIWMEKLQLLKEFIDQNQRRPINRAKEENEKFLSRWLSNQLKNYKKCEHGMKDHARREVWKQFMEEYSEFFLSTEEEWSRNFNKLKEFIDNNQRRPVQKAKEENEKFLGIWLCRQLKNYKNCKDGMKDVDRREIWKQFQEEYSEFLATPEEEWIRNLNQLKEFIDNNQRRPSTIAKEENEKFLANWLSTQLTNYKKCAQAMKDPARRDIWKQFMDEYSEFIATQEEEWSRNFKKLKKFIDQNQRRPVQKAKEENEKLLANWLSHQLKNYKKCSHGMKDPARREVWEKFMDEYSEFIATQEEEWIRNFNQVKDFIDQNQKRPSEKSKEENEKFLANWLSNQLTNYKKCAQAMKDPARREIWETFIDKYCEFFVSPEEEWNRNFNQLKEFIDQNQRRPINRAKEENEKFLGKWLSGQLTHYKKCAHGMKHLSRRKLFEELVNSNKSLFPNFEIVESNSKEEDENEFTKAQLNQLNNQKSRFDEWKNYLLENKRLPTSKESSRLQKLVRDFDKWLKDPSPHLSSLLQEYKEFIESEPVVHLFSSSINKKKKLKNPVDDDSDSLSSSHSPPSKKPRIRSEIEFRPVDASYFINNKQNENVSRSESSSLSAKQQLLPFNLEINPFKEKTNSILRDKCLLLQQKQPIRMLTLDSSNLRTCRTLQESIPSIECWVVERDEDTFRKQHSVAQELSSSSSCKIRLLQQPMSLMEFVQSSSFLQEMKQLVRLTKQPFFQVVYFDFCGSISDQDVLPFLKRGIVGNGTLLAFTFCKRDARGGSKFTDRLQDFLHSIESALEEMDTYFPCGISEIECYHYAGKFDAATQEDELIHHHHNTAMCTIFCKVLDLTDSHYSEMKHFVA